MKLISLFIAVILLTTVVSFKKRIKSQKIIKSSQLKTGKCENTWSYLLLGVFTQGIEHSLVKHNIDKYAEKGICIESIFITLKNIFDENKKYMETHSLNLPQTQRSDDESILKCVLKTVFKVSVCLATNISFETYDDLSIIAKEIGNKAKHIIEPLKHIFKNISLINIINTYIDCIGVESFLKTTLDMMYFKVQINVDDISFLGSNELIEKLYKKHINVLKTQNDIIEKIYILRIYNAISLDISKQSIPVMNKIKNVFGEVHKPLSIAYQIFRLIINILNEKDSCTKVYYSGKLIYNIAQLIIIYFMKTENKIDKSNSGENFFDSISDHLF